MFKLLYLVIFALLAVADGKGQGWLYWGLLAAAAALVTVSAWFLKDFSIAGLFV